MNIIEKKIAVKDYLTKSNLPASDYVINPYVGCPHACKYCYASIHTVLFMSPIFPYITEWKEIIHSTKGFVKEYWFENLNLRGAYKKTILGYVGEHYPDLRRNMSESIYRKTMAIGTNWRLKWMSIAGNRVWSTPIIFIMKSW